MLERVLEAEHVYVLRIGDITPHLHFHFVPRYPGAPRESWGPLHHQWPQGPKVESEEIIKISKMLRVEIQNSEFRS